MGLKPTGGAMVRIHGDILIARPPEVVFDFVADERNEPRFNSQMSTSVLESDEPIGKGTRFRVTFRSVGRLTPMSVEITGYERPRRLATHSKSRGAEIDGEMSFVPEAQGTRMRWSWDVQSKKLVRLFDPLVARQGERQERRIWGQLKALLEQGEPAVGAPSASAARAKPHRWVGRLPWTWGATADEVAALFPHGDLVPDGKRSPTMAVTIDCPPEQVWPWLVQMGWDRAGWYSWDLLDNAGRRSATEVRPEWQDLAVGDQLKYWAFGRVADAYRVAVVEPNTFLGLYGYTDYRGRWLDPEAPRPSSYMEALWGFLLEGRPDGRTRLVISGYQTFRPRWVERFAPWLLLALSWPMQSRMMTVLKRNIERAARSPDG